MIPKVIHYCWFGENALPLDAKRCISSWEKYCPDYDIKRWDEKNFDVESNQYIKTAYELKQWAFVSDYARLKIIYDNGGVYFDTDVEIIKNIDFMLLNDCYMGISQDGNINTGLGFGGVKHHEMIYKLLLAYNGLEFDINKKIPCPVIDTELFKKYGYSYENKDQEQIIEGVHLYPAKFMDPIILQGNNPNLLCDDTVSIHHYSGSWLSGWSRFKRTLACNFGVKRVQRLKQIIKNKI